MAKKLLQTKELIRDLMIDAFKGAFPEVKDVSNFPIVVENFQISEGGNSDGEEDDDYLENDSFCWLWLLPNGKAITFSQSAGFGYLARQPEKFQALYNTTQRATYGDVLNTYVIGSYAYKRKTYAAKYGYSTNDYEDVAVEYQFTNSFAKIPEYFEVLEADDLGEASKERQVFDFWKNVDNELEGFEIPVSLNGFILESDYEYYKNLVSNVNLEQLREEYRRYDFISDPIDLKNGINYSETQAYRYFDMIEYLQDKLKDSDNAHLIAYQGLDWEIRFPSFKNMEDLLSRRDELFASSKSDEEIKAFVQNYNTKLLYNEMEIDVKAKAIITGYDAENRPQAKLLSPNF